MQQKYKVTMTFCIYAKDDEDAVFKAKYIAARQARSKGDDSTVIGVDVHEEDEIRILYTKDEKTTIIKRGGPAWDDPNV